ncbi:ribonuclease H-like domain-containing protein [Crepidotus variabilis]|uniref:Ribonuclease H-like domain-containing protein n=1 Tax=Crepidotus variabilis TaxID=179855 RepID=A0A9P6JQA3_9AGAR|nr:ribonuclease H-like domain-containing protein [Crepidotus variabilis]
MSSHTIQLVDTTVLLDSCLLDITSLSTTKLAVDLEGVNLCRDGTISLLQILSVASQTIWIIDVTVLGVLAFSHSNLNGDTLKSVLEGSQVTKVFYDVRTDSDALFNLFGIKLSNTYDLQLLEVAARRSSGKKVSYVIGLGKVINQYIRPGSQWTRVKEEGAALLFPDKGGSYELFDKRPLDERVLQYSAQDVNLLFQLQTMLESEIGRYERAGWIRKVIQGSSRRVDEAHLPIYPKGRQRAIATFF